MTLLFEKYKTLFKTFLSEQWIYGSRILYLSIIFTFSLIAYYNLNKGFVMSSDSVWYSEAADEIIKLKFKLYSYYIQNTHTIPNFFYTLPILLIATLKLLFGAGWQYAFMIFNLILVLFLILLFAKILLLLKVRPLLISISILFLTTSVDLLTWPRYILTDVIFSFLVMSIICIATKKIVKDQNGNFLLISLMILLFLTRPTSIAFIIAITLFFLSLKIKANFNPKLILLIILSIFIFTPIIMAISFKLMSVNMNNNTQIFFIVEMVRSGMIIHDRPETWIETPHNIFEVINLYFTRQYYFFSPYIKSFSKIHIGLNLFQTFIFLFSIFIWFLLGKKFILINKLIFLILLISMLVTGFHSFTLIDYDFRYRFPLIVPLMMIFPLAIEIFLKKIVYKNFK